jgi:uncharacterized protein Yka (UPF0111/DUF47 family)
MSSEAFIKGELSTDYLDRFNIIARMQDYFNSSMKANADAIIAATLIYKNLSKYMVTMNSSSNYSKEVKKKEPSISLWKQVGRVMMRYGV